LITVKVFSNHNALPEQRMNHRLRQATVPQIPDNELAGFIAVYEQSTRHDFTLVLTLHQESLTPAYELYLIS
jgi:hypothetical protein